MPGAVGFDLDMTLVDSRPVSRHALERLASEHNLDTAAVQALYGLPLSGWRTAGAHPSLLRSLQPQDIASAKPMPGALAAVKAVRKSGCRVVVITGAPVKVATELLAAVGVTADRVRADVWAAEKVKPLREENCWAFVGDHADDMSAAREAGAIAIGVATGTSRPAGADVELAGLPAFPTWLAVQQPSQR